MHRSTHIDLSRSYRWGNIEVTQIERLTVNRPWTSLTGMALTQKMRSKMADSAAISKAESLSPNFFTICFFVTQSDQASLAFGPLSHFTLYCSVHRVREKHSSINQHDPH